MAAYLCAKHLKTKGRRIRHLRSYSAIAKGSRGQYNETKLKRNIILKRKRRKHLNSLTLWTQNSHMSLS